MIDLDGDERQTGSLISECKVHSFLRDRNASDFGIYDHLSTSFNGQRKDKKGEGE